MEKGARELSWNSWKRWNKDCEWQRIQAILCTSDKNTKKDENDNNNNKQIMYEGCYNNNLIEFFIPSNTILVTLGRGSLDYNKTPHVLVERGNTVNRTVEIMKMKKICFFKERISEKIMKKSRKIRKKLEKADVMLPRTPTQSGKVDSQVDD